jgi:hypothetical protein
VLTSDPALDDPALAWLFEYIAAAASGVLTQTQLAEHAEALARGPVERHPKRLRLYYLGDMLLRLEAAGLTRARAIVAAPYVARGQAGRRRRLEPLTEHERRGALKARKALDEAAADRGLRAAPLSQTPSPRERERKASAERRQHGRVAAHAQREPKVIDVPFFAPGRLRLLLAVMIADHLPEGYEQDGAELVEALDALAALDPRQAARIRADPQHASDADLGWLVAQTRTALQAFGLGRARTQDAGTATGQRRQRSAA